jgi:Nuclease subunit of the excinuclease complex
MQLPNLPGVYIFKDADNTIIYVGKAKSLKKRVASYFQKKDNDWKVHALIEEHATIEHIVTHSEHEALLLEAQLIRDYKPKYNVLLKEGNPYIYFLFTESAEGHLPELKLVRTKGEKGTYLGPFLYKKSVRTVYSYIMRTFKLQLCHGTVTGGCLNFHLGYCAGNCAPAFDIAEYITRLQLAESALRGDYEAFKTTIHAQIYQLNKSLAFERAMHLHEYLDHAEKIFETIKTGFTTRRYRRDIAQATTQQPLASNRDMSAGLNELQALLGLPSIPTTIDCFDISHFQSRYIVGSCIRFTQGVPEKNKFRRFKIKTLAEQNDYAALQEIVSRRYKNGDFPDVILIDGGKGQRNAVKDIFPQTPCISLAKREERLFTDLHPEGVVLDIQTTLGQLLISLRDYAHHFAVQYHQLLQKKGVRAP